MRIVAEGLCPGDVGAEEDSDVAYIHYVEEDVAVGREYLALRGAPEIGARIELRQGLH